MALASQHRGCRVASQNLPLAKVLVQIMLMQELGGTHAGVENEGGWGVVWEATGRGIWRRHPWDRLFAHFPNPLADGEMANGPITLGPVHVYIYIFHLAQASARS